MAVARASEAKRLTWGLGVIALGVLGALPYRHAPSPVQNATRVAPQIQLGQSVPLQVPGQQAVTGFPAARPEPLVADEEPPQPAIAIVRKTAIETLVPPPRLPDEYLPLFRPEASPVESQGGVTQTRNGALPPFRKAARRHTIHDGDSLEKLAQRYFGDARRADEILAANREVLSDPDVLPIGVEIVIPRGTPDRELPETGAAGSIESRRRLVPLPAIGMQRGR